MSTHQLQLMQSVGIIVAIGFTLYQIVRFRTESERTRYLESDRRYVDWVKIAIEMENPPLGYDMSLVQHFLSLGGTKNELLFYDMLFATWESSYLLYKTKQKAQWMGWEKWIRAFFIGQQRCLLAWEIAGRYYDQHFVDYVEDNILNVLDSRFDHEFPNTVEEWNRLPIRVDDEGLSVGPFQVMQRWEEPLMRTMADIVGQHGDVLEVGFGLGMASMFIQENRITSHTILEPHPQLFDRLTQWAKGRSTVRPINQSWERWTRTAPENSFDGILFDTFPIRRSELHRNQFPFFNIARRLLRSGGLFTYYSDEARHVCGEHQEALLKEFSQFSVRMIDVQPSAACEYWQAKTILVIVATK